MKQKQVEELMACLKEDRKVFFYHKGRYASLLMNEILQYQTDIREIKKSSFAKLLNVNSVKKFLNASGGGLISPEAICYDWEEETFPFTITYSEWGNERFQWQTSRKGKNLVLQLNFSNKHAEQYKRLYKPKHQAHFNYGGHPIVYDFQNIDARETLAWARIDLDFSTNEALIEEIQTDWLRKAKWELARILIAEEKGETVKARCSEASIENAKKYLVEVLAKYEKIWAEAILAASLHVLQNDIGIDNVFYHTHISGRIIKNIPGGSPPRSLYTNLPKRFCFQEAKYGPSFIEDQKVFRKKRRSYPFLKWHKLNIKGEFNVEKKNQSAATQAA